MLRVICIITHSSSQIVELVFMVVFQEAVPSFEKHLHDVYKHVVCISCKELKINPLENVFAQSLFFMLELCFK